MGRTVESSTSLVIRMQGGDREALGELWDATQARLLRVIDRIVRNHADSEDVLLEVYVQAWQRASDYDARLGSADAWLYAIARSRALDLLRRRARHARQVVRVDAVQEPADLGPSPEQRVSRAWDERAATRALSSLSSNQRQAIELNYLQEKPHPVAAACLGVPLGTLKTRIRAGLSVLRDRLVPVA